MKNDPLLVAWAAGLYDGEGSASMFMPQRRKTARRQMQVSQGGEVGSPPEVLLRFREIVGVGNVTGPYRDYLFYWKTTRKDAIDALATRLWPFLSSEKRAQLVRMTAAAGRALPTPPPLLRDRSTELAWAAGLFDGEGSLSESGTATTPSISAELPQSSAYGIPETLLRFRDVVGVGSIGGPYPPRSAWSRLSRYRWQTSGRHAVSRLLSALWPRLSSIKRARALALRSLLDPEGPWF